MATFVGSGTVLRGQGIVVTRPAAQAEAFCAALEERGAKVLRFPAMEIQPLSFSEQRLCALPDYALVIFISVNAVQNGLPRLIDPKAGHWPSTVYRVAIGQRTAEELALWGFPAHIVPPSGFDSEALLSDPSLQQIVDRRILIVRGEGGRELLGNTLRERGARVEYAEVYRRIAARNNPDQLLDWYRHNRVSAITITSRETLRFLLEQMGALPGLLQTPLITGAERVKNFARDCGFCGPIVTAENPTDSAMLRATLDYFQDATAAF